MRFDADVEPPCTVDPESWFSDDKDIQATAQRVCASCPFQEPCAELRDLPFDRPLDDDGPIERAEFGTWAGETLVPPLVTNRHSVDLTPRQIERNQRIERVRVLLSGGRHTKADICRELEISFGSLNHIINNYLTLED